MSRQNFGPRQTPVKAKLYGPLSELKKLVKFIVETACRYRYLFRANKKKRRYVPVSISFKIGSILRAFRAFSLRKKNMWLLLTVKCL